jgi:hypothetical protein
MVMIASHITRVPVFHVTRNVTERVPHTGFPSVIISRTFYLVCCRRGTPGKIGWERKPIRPDSARPISLYLGLDERGSHASGRHYSGQPGGLGKKSPAITATILKRGFIHVQMIFLFGKIVM